MELEMILSSEKKQAQKEKYSVPCLIGGNLQVNLIKEKNRIVIIRDY